VIADNAWNELFCASEIALLIRLSDNVGNKVATRHWQKNTKIAGQMVPTSNV
jgi:hypothetical protein